MIFLSIETSSNICGVAISDETIILARREFEHKMQLSERLIPEIDKALNDAEKTLANIDCFIVGVGPGSFTGVRVGVMTAKCWAQAMQKPLIAVNALEALLSSGSALATGITHAIVKARPGYVYWKSNSQTDPKSEAIQTITVQEAASRITADSNAQLFGDLPDDLAALLHSASFTGMIGLHPATVESVALVGYKMFHQAIFSDPLTLEPLYVSPPPIRSATTQS